MDYYKTGAYLDTPDGRLHQIQPAAELTAAERDMAAWVQPHERIATYMGFMVCSTAPIPGAVEVEDGILY